MADRRPIGQSQAVTTITTATVDNTVGGRCRIAGKAADLLGFHRVAENLGAAKRLILKAP
jgi:hypothetical protein